MKPSTLASFLLITTLSCQAFTGNDLYEACRLHASESKEVKEEMNKTICISYFIGFRDAQQFSQAWYQQAEKLKQNSQCYTKENCVLKYHFCLPQNIGIDQMINIVMQYLNEHPAEKNDYASYAVYRALKQTFPCK